MYKITSSPVLIKSKTICKQVRHKLSHDWHKRATMMLAMFALIFSLAGNCTDTLLDIHFDGGDGAEINRTLVETLSAPGQQYYGTRGSSYCDLNGDGFVHEDCGVVIPYPLRGLYLSGSKTSSKARPALFVGYADECRPKALPPNLFVREGYEFMGYSTSPNGPVQYQPGDIYSYVPWSNTCYDLDEDRVVFYSIWSEQDNALHFDGVNDNAITTTLNVDQSVVPITTWEAWVCPTTNDQNSRMIMGVEDGGCDRYVAMNGGNFVIGTGTGSCTWSPVAIDLNRWQHIAVVYNEAAGVVKFYKNGVAYSSSLSGHSTAVKFGIGSAQTGAGGGASGASQFFKGMIDEVRVWRGAKTQTQLQEAMYRELTGNFTDLIAYYKFNQGKASAPNAGVTTLRDSSGNGHHATMSNFALTGDTSNWVKSLAMMVPNAVEPLSKTTTSFMANWDAPVTGKVDNYVLDVARNASFTDMVAQGLNAYGRWYSVSGLTPGTTYYYRVRANRTGAAGQGVFSNIISVQTITADANLNGLSFDGINDYLEQASGWGGVLSPCPFSGNSDHTIEFNVLYQGGQTGIRHLLNIAAGGDNQSEIIGFQGETGLLYSSHGINQTGVTASTAALIPNRWTHVALVYTGSNKSMALYINGTFVETFSYTSDLAIPNTNSIVIGAKLVSGGMGIIVNNASKIVMDEFRIWDVARSESQIKTTLNNELIGTESNLKVYYDFNEGIRNGDNRPTFGAAFVSDKTRYYPCNRYNFANIGNTSNIVESYAMVVPKATYVTNITATGFTANWTAPTIGTVDNYVLELSRNATFTDKVAGYDGLSVSGTSVAVTGLAAGTTYYYRVRANKASVTGQGTFSNVVSSESRGKNALSFNGTTNFVTMPSSASPFTGNADHTIEFNVLYKGGQTGFRSLLWYGNQNDNQIELIGYDGVTGLLKNYHSTNVNDEMAVTAALVLNHWTHVAMVYTGSSKTVAIYVNGTYVETLNYNTNLAIPNNSVMQLGTYAGDGGFACRAVLDEVRIWDVARTASQIKGTMNSELVGTEANLKRYYNFNQGTAGGTNSETSLTDRTANAYHGTLTNFNLTGDSSNWVESYAMVVPTAIAPGIIFGGFIANWTAPTIGTVDNYVLDVSTSASFDTFVSGYNGLSVSGTSREVSGLSAGTTYYYRVRADKASVTGQGAFSNIISVQTLRTDPNVGNALSFDGIDDGLWFINDLPTTGNPDHTLEFYVLYKGGQTGIQSLCTIGNTLTADEKIGFDGTTGLIYCAQQVNNSVRTATTAALIPNRWTHLAAVYTGSSRTMAIYVNGIYVESFNYTSNLAFNNANTDLGRNSKIVLDEFRMWNVARTESQIKANLNTRLSGTESNLRVYYDFNQGIPGGDNRSSSFLYITDRTAYDSRGLIVYNGNSAFALTGNTSNFVESYAMVVPTATAATNATATGFTANWTAPAIGIVDNYVLDVSRNTTFTDLVAGYNGLSVSGISAAVTGLAGGTTYYYRVRADKAAVTGQGTFSNVISTQTISMITYNGNNNTGGSVPTETTGSNGASVTLASNSGSLTRTGYTFGGWNTVANGSGTSYAAGASYTLSGDVTLYAKWNIPPTITSFTPLSGNPGTLVTITGTDLGSPTAFTIGGATAIVVSTTGTSVVGMVMPGATTGTISISTAGGTATGSGTFTVTATPYPSAQQGSKLAGTGATGASRQGFSLAISADGNTAIVGGVADNSYAGAAWIYTRSGGIWTQQGGKLVGTGATVAARQGSSVALSADGNTAMVGGYTDNNLTGAAWVYTRSGSTWSQQGSKLVGTGATGAASQGYSVSLSADGNTAMVGGYYDNDYIGAAWVYARSGSTWSQQGSKLVGTGNAGWSLQGASVSLSADGSTAMVGGYYDNNADGAAWVYSRSGSTWSQQGSKLVGTGAVGAYQGYSVSLSADGNTAIVGGPNDDSNAGASWVYTRSGSTWSQQGSKLVATGATGTASQGQSVSLSADGNTAMVGGFNDNSAAGAAWVFTRSGSSWSQRGSKLVGTGATGTANQGYSVALSADGNTAILGGYGDNSYAGAAWVYFLGNTVTYNGNSNTGGTVPEVITGANGASVTLASNSVNLTRTGYTFGGWNTLANGAGTSYATGASYTLAGDITLYAQWTLTSTPPDNALHFDGYDDNAITTTLDTDTSVVPVTTWEAWVYPTTNDGEYRMIMSIEDGGCDRFVAINSGNFVVGIGTVACLWSPVAIDLNKWQHIAVVYDEGAGIAKFYKNGVEYISGLSGHSATVKFGIGCSQQNGNGPAGATQFFQGAIDELRVWEVARTQSEIQSTMYNELVGNETNLLAYYNFNQGIASETNYSVTTLIDVTGHGHDAPLSNFALSGATSNWVESYAMVVPTASAATSIADTSFTANWTAPVTGIYTHYVLDVATDPTFTYKVSGYDGLAVAGTSENVTGLPTGLTYYFRVRADKTSVTGQGAYSNVIAVAVGTPAVMSAPGNALYFDGTTDFVSVPSGASPFTGNADHTVEFNVLYKGGQTGDRWLLWYGTLAGDQIEVIGYNGETGLIKDHHVSAGNDITATTAALVPNKWTHVAMVYTGASRTMAIYINGAYVETFYYASDLAIPDYAPLQLGTFYSIADGVNFTCHMALDEVRIWDVARTESEIRATMYNELAGNETNLKVYYNFNQGTASGTNTPITALTDRTANGYHGTLNNFDLVGDTSNWVESYAMVVPTASAATSITSAGFTANWTAPAIGIVTNYLLDVATDPSFTAMVFGYDGLSVSGTSQAITGLSPGATYYYRVRADKTSVTGQGAYAAVQTVQLAVDYTITFVPPAGLAGMPNQTIAAGATANLSANTMTNPGYTFAGWATTPGGAVVYSDGASYTMGAADVTLWSTWIAINPTGVISGNAEICAGTPTQLSIALTGTAPWSGTLSDGTPFSGSESPLLLSVTPTESTIYTIATLTSATATATVGDLSGSAAITALPSPAPVITGNLSFCVGGATTLSTGAGVQGIRQYASEVLDFSSEYTSDCGPWSSCQVLGEPNVYPDYGDRADNWSNESPNGGFEYLELGFSTPAPINYVDIYETYSPGSIYQVSLKNNTTGLYEVVYAVTAEPDSEESRMLHLTFPLTSYDVSAVRIDMDTALFDSFIQIDAVAIGANDSNTYLWSTGETTSSIAVSTAGNYTVTATNTSGCSATSAISTVSVQSCISGNTAVCAGTSAQLSIALTGQGPWSGTLSDGTPFSGSDNPLLVTVTPTANTTYTIATLSNATSEDLGGSAMVSVNPLPTVVIEATTNDLATATIVTNSSVALCEGGSVNLAVQADNTSATLVPLDQDSGATLAVGLRKLKSAYAGSAIRLRRSSDNQEQDFGFAGNNLDTAAISTWLNGTTGFCTTLYDQSGHGGDIRQSNSTAQPMYVESGINNKPMLHFTTTQSLVNQVNYPAPFSVIYGSRVTGQSERALAAQYNNWLLGYWGGYKDQAYFEGWITTPGNDSQSDNAYNIYAASASGTTSNIYKNGNLLISNGQGLEGPNGIGFNTGENSDFDFTDLMVFGTELSIQNIQKYNNSIGQYYGSGTVALNTYQWSTGATTPSIAVSTAGDYAVTVTNNYGCSATTTTQVVVNSSVLYYSDTDGDGYGSGVATLSCTAISGAVTNNTDCDDTDVTKWQFATFYVDADADGYTNGTASVCSGVGAPTGYSSDSSGIDCDDTNNMVYQLNLFYTDVDGDGYTNGYAMASLCSGVGIPLGYSTATLGEDCNDNNNSVYQINLLYTDADGDNVTVGNGTLTCIGATLPAGTQLWQYSTVDDCDDNNPDVFQFNPLYTDEDYDGYTVGPASLVCYGFSLPLGTSSNSSGEDCDDRDSSFYQYATFYLDADADGYDNGSASVCSGVGAPTGYSSDSSGIDCDDTNALLTINCGGGSVVNLTMFIEGYYLGGNTMNSVRWNQDYVSPSDEVEVMTVNLHDATTYELVDTATGTLKTDGTLSVTFTTAAAGSYYLAVKGVNMIETWTATPQVIGTTPLRFDFSSAASQAYGNNMREIEPGVFAFYQGDINQDGSVDNSDYDQLFPDIENSAFGVQATDLNGDGAVDNSDTDFIPLNVENSIFANYPF